MTVIHIDILAHHEANLQHGIQSCPNSPKQFHQDDPLVWQSPWIGMCQQRWNIRYDWHYRTQRKNNVLTSSEWLSKIAPWRKKILKMAHQYTLRCHLWFSSVLFMNVSVSSNKAESQGNMSIVAPHPKTIDNGAMIEITAKAIKQNSLRSSLVDHHGRIHASSVQLSKSKSMG